MFPYYTLQLRTLGLSLDDAALVGLSFFNLLSYISTDPLFFSKIIIILMLLELSGGLCPILAFICGPLLGYLGDKLGFKTVRNCSVSGWPGSKFAGANPLPSVDGSNRRCPPIPPGLSHSHRPGNDPTLAYIQKKAPTFIKKNPLSSTTKNTCLHQQIKDAN